jgi:hypothetical protein
MIDGAAAPPSQAPTASHAEAACRAIIYNETLNRHWFERLVAVGARHYYIVYRDDCEPSAKSTGKIDLDLLSRYVAEQVS